jgi:hypothetical protein
MNDIYAHVLPKGTIWKPQPHMQSGHQGKGWLLWRIANINYIFWLLNEEGTTKLIPSKEAEKI